MRLTEALPRQRNYFMTTAEVRSWWGGIAEDTAALSAKPPYRRSCAGCGVVDGIWM